MVDLPGRSAYEPEDRADPPDTGVEADDGGWGSPLPAEYGSLHAVRPPERRASPAGEGSPVAGGLFSAWARGRRNPDPAGATDGVRAMTERGTEGGADAAPAERPLRPVGGISTAERDVAAAAPTGVIPVVDREPVAPASPMPDREPLSYRDAMPSRDALPSRDPVADPEPTATQPAVEPDPRPPWAPAGDSASAFPAAAGLGAGAGGMAAATEATRPPMPRPGPPLRPGRRPGRARSRVVLRHLDISTVAKVSVIFYLLVLVIIVVAAVLLWAAADSFGTLPSIQKSVRTLFSLRSFQLHVGAVAMYTGAAGVVIAVVGTIANILLAMIYNFIADVVGGIRVELESFGRE